MRFFDKQFRKFQNGSCGNNLFWYSMGKKLIINGSGAMKSYSPYEKSPWFYVDYIIEEVIIEKGVTSIGAYAFFNNRGLFKVDIAESVNSIGWSAFSGCRDLENIKIPDSVDFISGWAFVGCHSLTEIKVPENVDGINQYTFCNCSSLRKVILPSSITYIDDRAFCSCNKLEEILIPDSVTYIGEEIFNYCSSLKEIYYPAGRNFESKLCNGNYARLIPIDNLRWKVEGKTLTVGGVSEIKSYSYEATPWRDSLRDIQRIIIEDGVRKIDANAFAECTRLEQLTIPASVKTIGDGAFTFCYCGDRTINGGRNVIWSLEDGTLMIKKNPAAKNESNFSTGYETWQVVEGNITGVKIERGIVPGKNFFDWLGRMGDGVSVAF